MPLLSEVAIDPVNIVQVGSVLAILGWIVKVWLPKITEDFRTDIAAARISAAEQSQLARNTYAAEIAATRQSYTVSLDKIMQHCLDEAAENRAFHQRERDTMLAHIERIRNAGYVQVPKVDG